MMWERPNDPDLRRAAGARHRGLPADAHPRRRQAQAQPEQDRRGRRDGHRRAERRRAVRRTRGWPPRCAAPATRWRARDGGRRRRSERSRTPVSPAPARELLPADGPVDVHLANGADRRHRPGRRAPSRRRGPRRGRRMARSRASGTITCMCVQWALVAQRDPLGARGVGRPCGRIMGAGDTCRTTAGASAPASATRCGRTRPTLDVLDAATGDIPTYLINADVHSVWLNTAALRREGSRTRRGRHPPRGAGIRDLAPAERRGPGCGRPARGDDGAGMPRPAASSGSSTSTWRGTRRPGRAGSTAASTTLRVEFGIYPEFLDRAIAEGLRTGDRGAGGGIRSRARRLAEGHHRRIARHAHRGVLARVPRRPAQSRRPGRRSRRRCVELMTAATGSGHLVRDPRDRRHRELACARRVRRSPAPWGTIEHAQLVAHADIPRFARLGVGASVQPEHAIDDRDLTDCDLGRADRTAVPAALARRLRREPPLRFGRTGRAARPVGGDRRRRSSAPATVVGLAAPSSGVDAATALAASTHGGSTAAARIEPGALADLALCERDPLTASEPELRAMARVRDAPRRSCDAPGAEAGQPPRRRGLTPRPIRVGVGCRRHARLARLEA